MHVVTALAEFLSACRSRCESDELSPRTLCTYRSFLSRFVAQLPPSGNFPDDTQLLTAWVSLLKDANYSPSTQHTYREVLCVWLDWCVDCRIISCHGARGLSVPKILPGRRRKVSASRFDACLEACELLPTPFEQVRARALVMVAFTVLLRRSELLGLRIHHLHLGEDPPWLLVELGKGRKSVWLPISDRCRGALRAWLAVRDARQPVTDWLWLNESGMGRSEHMGRDPLYNLCAFLADKVGCDRADVLPHAFRRGGATSMLQAHIDIGTVSRMLRHASIATTMIYTEADSARLEEVRNWMEERKIVGPVPPVAPVPDPAEVRRCRDPRQRPAAARRPRLAP